MNQQSAAVSISRQHWQALLDELAEARRQRHLVTYRALLERLVRVTQRRFPVVGDLARSIRFRWFDQPQVDAERASVLAGIATAVKARRPDVRVVGVQAEQAAAREAFEALVSSAEETAALPTDV